MKKVSLFFLLLFGMLISNAQTNLSGFYPNANVSGLRFGTATAIHENTIVVSSASNTLPPVTTGYVYVFQNNNGTLSQETFFYPSDALVDDAFGKSLAASDEFIAVGSPFHDQNVGNSGAVYLYRKVNNQWTFFQKITASDASFNKQFGSFITLQGNSLFVVAPNDENNDGIGAVYVYQFNETEWILSQKLTVPNNTRPFGKIVVQENQLLVSNVLNTTYYSPSHFYTFTLNNNWTLYQTSQEFGNLEQILIDFSYDQNRLYLSVHELNEGTNGSYNKIYIYNNVNNNWEPETAIETQFNDFINGNIVVSGNNLLLGYSSYYLQMGRKFPVFFYKKIEGLWQLLTNFYGEGEFNMDDRLGNSISMFESNVVIGAFIEGGINTGKAYFLNLENLSTTSFSRENTIIYPNPTSSIITVKNNGSSEMKSFEIYSVTGKKIKHDSLTNNSISMENLPSGIYFLKLYFDNDRIENHKIIKQ